MVILTAALLVAIAWFVLKPAAQQDMQRSEVRVRRDVPKRRHTEIIDD
ncbi:MAG: hypothetical protein AAF479_00385 [Pseudomonadota bacterium]